MRPLSVWMVLSVWITSVALGAFVSVVLVGSGRNPLVFTPWLTLLFVLVGLWILAAGIAVRRLKRREKTWISPIGAGRTAIFARSSAPLTAAFSGFLLGVALVGLARSWAPMMAYSGWVALAGAVGAGFAAVMAVIVERWSIDDSDDEDERGPGAVKGGNPSPHHSRTAAPASQDVSLPERR